MPGIDESPGRRRTGARRPGAPPRDVQSLARGGRGRPQGQRLAAPAGNRTESAGLAGTVLGVAALIDGEVEAGLRRIEESLATARTLGEPDDLALAGVCLADYYAAEVRRTARSRSWSPSAPTSGGSHRRDTGWTTCWPATRRALWWRPASGTGPWRPLLTYEVVSASPSSTWQRRRRPRRPRSGPAPLGAGRDPRPLRPAAVPPVCRRCSGRPRRRRGQPGPGAGAGAQHRAAGLGDGARAAATGGGRRLPGCRRLRERRGYPPAARPPAGRARRSDRSGGPGPVSPQSARPPSDGPMPTPGWPRRLPGRPPVVPTKLRRWRRSRPLRPCSAGAVVVRRPPRHWQPHVASRGGSRRRPAARRRGCPVASGPPAIARRRGSGGACSEGGRSAGFGPDRTRRTGAAPGDRRATNREIGQLSPYISPKTASVHVTQPNMQKLGVGPQGAGAAALAAPKACPGLEPARTGGG